MSLGTKRVSNIYNVSFLETFDCGSNRSPAPLDHLCPCLYRLEETSEVWTLTAVVSHGAPHYHSGHTACEGRQPEVTGVERDC